jgi:hypothetical protein
MLEAVRKAPRLVALCMLGCVLFNYPVLALFNVSGSVLGIPILYFYIFTAWAVFILLMALAVDRGSWPGASMRSPQHEWPSSR